MSENKTCELIPAWAWGLLIGLPVFFILGYLYWWLTRPSDERVSAIEIETTFSRKPEPENLSPDDLTKLKGIGPKIAETLKSHGVLTFQQIALSDPEEIQDILREEGIRLANPGSWPDQARLAALSRWDELEALQETL